MSVRLLELYSGIGGMHFAFKECGIEADVVAAVDINTLANSVYRWNFPGTKILQRNILSLTAQELDTLKIDIITMSPPCQPFTRQGLQKDSADRRTDSLFSLLDEIQNMKSKPSYILMENVKGFEESDTRTFVINILEKCGYSYQEYLLTPTQFRIPNSRLRYYLLAKFKVSEDDTFQKIDTVITEPPFLQFFSHSCETVGEYLEESKPLEYLEPFSLPDKVLSRYHISLDIVTKESKSCCCFTKGYGHYVDGTGSVIKQNCEVQVEGVYSELDKLTEEEKVASLRRLGLRYFTPTEISKLMGFPESFCFPPNTTTKQKYRLLGNSINVKVVATLLKCLLEGPG